MANKKKKPFKTLAVWGGGSGESSVFATTDSLGEWIDPFSHTLFWNEFSVYGVPDSEADSEDGWGEDYSKATLIGGIRGCHIPVSLINNLGEDPYEVCDASDADLEAMYSVLQEHNDGELLDFVDNIFYIHEIELLPEYRGCEYEELLLLQLPAVIAKSLRVFPDLLMYLPTLLTSEAENGSDDDDSRSWSNWQRMLVKDGDGNIAMLAPEDEISEKERRINQFLGRRNPGDIVPCLRHGISALRADSSEYNVHSHIIQGGERDPNLYKTYKTVGFEEIGKTGWLYKQITSVFSLDGKARQATGDNDDGD
jgi:hypothetical protein